MDTTHVYRRDLLRTVQEALTLLHGDTQRSGSGYEFYDVIDFAAIYAYVYKQSGPPFASLKNEAEEKTFARCQMALKMLFTTYPRPLLLIPPYSAELRNHLLSVKTNLGLAALDAGALYKEKLSRLIAGSEEFQQFLNARAEHQVDEIDEKVWQSALKVGKEFFPELYAALAFLLTDGPGTFRTLLAEETIQDADEALPECKEMPYHGPETDSWYSKINEQREGKRSAQSYTDAMACRYVEFANEKLRERKKVIVFVSPSTLVKEVVEARTPTPCDREKTSAVRDLTYCLLAAVHKNDIGMIGESLDAVRRLLELYESPTPLERQDIQKRDEAASLWNRCENLLLMGASTFPDIPSGKASTKREAEFLDLLRQLHLAATTGKEDMAKQLEQDFSQMQDIVTELRSNIPAESERASRQDYLHITFPGLPDELTIELRLVEKGVMRLARTLERLAKAKFSEESVSSLKAKIQKMADDRDATVEQHLLAGYVLALERQYEAALAQLEKGHRMAFGLQRAQLLFVSAAILRKLYRGDEACDLLYQAIAICPSDPRFRIELAKALWVRWRNGSRSVGDRDELEEALEQLRVADHDMAASSNRGLQAQLENTAAYVYTEQAMADPARSETLLNQARAHLTRLEKILPEKDWLGRFFDTRGYWYCARAKQAKADSISKNVLRRQAESDFRRALGKKEDSVQEMKIRQEHYNLILSD